MLWWIFLLVPFACFFDRITWPIVILSENLNWFGLVGENSPITSAVAASVPEREDKFF
jgi:hypothetical protein